MSKNTVRVIASGGSGTSYYLSGSGTEYTGSGTPWTVENTSPYTLALNEVTGNNFIPHASQGITQYLGGPPFQNGASPIYNGYGNVVETMGLQLTASTKDNAVALIRQLRQVMNTALYSLPALLAVQGGTNTVYYEIYRADIQEDPRYLFEPEGRWRTTITMTRSATGGLLTTGETVVNNITLNNRGTGSPSNNTAYSTGTGDLINEGSPINIVATGGSGAGTTWGASAKTYMASILANSYLVSGATLVASTGGLLGSRSTFDLSPLLTNRGIRLRLCAVVTMPNDSRVWVNCYFGTGTSGTQIYSSPVLSSVGVGVSTFFDFGFLPNDIVRRAKGLTAPNLYTDLRVSAGAAGNFTLVDFQFITYYDWCGIEFDTTYQGNQVIQIDSFPEQSNTALLPYTPKAWHQISSTAPKSPGRIRGTAPRYFAGARFFWAANRADGTYSGSDTVAFVGTHAPQYLTLRGNG